MSNLLHELDHRSSDRIDVWMLWRERDNRVLVAVFDEKTGERFKIEVRQDERPLDVFHHPFAYAAWRGIDTRSETSEAMSWAASVSHPDATAPPDGGRVLIGGHDVTRPRRSGAHHATVSDRIPAADPGYERAEAKIAVEALTRLLDHRALHVSRILRSALTTLSDGGFESVRAA